jgi:putative ABC transport system substrate-binding protein
MPGNNCAQDKIRKRWTGLIWVVGFSLLLAACGGGPQAQETFTIGVIAETSMHTPAIEGFKAGLADLGYVEGENVTYIYNGTIGYNSKAIDDKIKNLLAQQIDMLFVLGLPTVQAKQAVEGTDIPVVFGAISRPVERGIVESISHPGGNLTGVQVGNEIPKALDWLVRITPNAKKIYVPYHPDDELSVMFLAMLDKVASQLKIELVPGETHSVEEAVAAIESIPADIEAIFRIPSPTLDPKNNELSQAALNRGLPMAAGHPLDEAALLTYAADFFEVGKQAARLAHQIRQGVKPAELPIETAEFFLTINLKTAAAIGLDIPDDILAQADTLIR